MDKLKYICPVCGYPELYEPPRSESTGGGSYEICECCRFQFSVTDDDRGVTYLEWRETWIAKGMPWNNNLNISQAPSRWDPNEQLGRLMDLEKKKIN